VLAKAYNLPGQRELLTELVSLVDVYHPEVMRKAEEILKLEQQISSLKTK
jgi:hypothetical protein